MGVFARAVAPSAALARPQGVYKAAHVRLVNVLYLQFLLYQQTKARRHFIADGLIFFTGVL